MIVNFKTLQGSAASLNIAKMTLTIQDHEIIDAPVSEVSYSRIILSDTREKIIPTAYKEEIKQAMLDYKKMVFDAAIPGYDILTDAYNKIENYHYNLSRKIERGVCVFDSEPDIDLDALRAEYPRAATYIKADSYCSARNDKKYSAGVKAKALLLSGGTIGEAEEILNNWVGDYVD